MWGAFWGDSKGGGCDSSLSEKDEVPAEVVLSRC